MKMQRTLLAEALEYFVSMTGFWFWVAVFEVAALGTCIALCRNLFAIRIGILGMQFEVPTPVFIIVLWLTVSVPVTFAAWIIRRVVC
jgi:hypothetical protein